MLVRKLRQLQALLLGTWQQDTFGTQPVDVRLQRQQHCLCLPSPPQMYGWQWGMFAPGLVGVVMGLLILLGVRDSPEASKLVLSLPVDSSCGHCILLTCFLKPARRESWLYFFACMCVFARMCLQGAGMGLVPARREEHSRAEPLASSLPGTHIPLPLLVATCSRLPACGGA